MVVLPTFAMEKLLKKAGAKRVSEPAKEALQKTLEKKLEQATKKATLFAKHAGRKTIKKEDVLLTKN
jgi:DNA-binding protein